MLCKFPLIFTLVILNKNIWICSMTAENTNEKGIWEIILKNEVEEWIWEMNLRIEIEIWNWKMICKMKLRYEFENWWIWEMKLNLGYLFENWISRMNSRSNIEKWIWGTVNLRNDLRNESFEFTWILASLLMKMMMMKSNS